MIVISLECGHSKRVREKLEVAYCKYCGTHQAVVADGYRVKCKNCRYARYFGSSDFSARIFGTKHALIKHHVVILYNPEGVEVETLKTSQPELPLDGSPPF